jgi:hypothetical protein
LNFGRDYIIPKPFKIDNHGCASSCKSSNGKAVVTLNQLPIGRNTKKNLERLGSDNKMVRFNQQSQN